MVSAIPTAGVPRSPAATSTVKNLTSPAFIRDLLRERFPRGSGPTTCPGTPVAGNIGWLSRPGQGRVCRAASWPPWRPGILAVQPSDGGLDGARGLEVDDLVA